MPYTSPTPVPSYRSLRTSVVPTSRSSPTPVASFRSTDRITTIIPPVETIDYLLDEDGDMILDSEGQPIWA